MALHAMNLPRASSLSDTPQSSSLRQLAYSNGPTLSAGTASTGAPHRNDHADVSADADGDSHDSPHNASSGPLPALHNAAAHRSVLGSGIQSTAVQEAQMQARKKAEVFANARKRKRVEQPDQVRRVAQVPSEDSKLTPEERKRKRYERRLALNRESAAVSRVRRREYVKLLEERLVSAEKERVRLATELEDMQHQHNKLQEHLQKLEGDIDGGSS